MDKRIEELYQRYLSGELTPSELEDLKRQVPFVSDEELWNLMCEDFSSSSESARMTYESQQKVLRNIHEEIRKDKWHSRARRLLRIASMLILIISLAAGSYLWYESFTPTAPVYTYVSVKAGNKSTITLPDGTRVSLNGNSQLRYNVVPSKHRGVVLMKGEAYFDVAKDANCPFRVHVNDMQIEVLGTKFNVRCQRGEVETALFSGAVRLTAKGLSESYRLFPGRKSIYQPSARSMQICDNDTDIDGRWKDGYLAFDSEPLREVLRKIEDWYGVHIMLNNKQIGEDQLTGAFYHETLESVLSSLSMQYKFKYTINHDQIEIR
mgnify:CR=1 FL=1